MQTDKTSDTLDTYLTLNNGVRLAFADASSNPVSSLKSAISVTLNKGHFHAGDYPEGFSHLYEHLLFCTSSRYKNSNALDQHLFKFQGQVNAWTQDHLTNFQLSCEQAGLLDACDILFDRLGSPLFLEPDIEREIAAIDAEFKGQLTDPVRRLLSVQKATSNPKHPFSRFSAGNKSTLLDRELTEIKDTLFRYHQQTMIPSNIFICIGLGVEEKQAENSLSLKQSLIKMIEDCFAVQSIESLQPPSFVDKQPPSIYLPKQLATLIKIKQDKAHHQLIVSYVISNSQSQQLPIQRDALYIVICHLLESKHQGGLYAQLLALGYASHIQSYYKSLDGVTDEIVLSIQLSDLGACEPQMVYALAQSYMDFFSSHGIESWRFREKGQQYRLNTNIQSKAGLLERCIDTSQHMAQQHPDLQAVEDAFCHQHTYAQLPKILSQCQLERARLYFVSPKIDGTELTPHFEVPYSVEPLNRDAPSGNSASTHNTLYSLPRQNPYMSEHHPMVSQQIKSTSLLEYNDKQLCLKFYQFTEFGLPNGECFISISDLNMYQNVEQIAMKRVWLACLNEHLHMQFFDVELASIHFRVYPHQHGISIHTGGFSERQLLLCIELINAVKSFTASKTALDRHLQRQRNIQDSKPKQRALNQLFSYLNEYYQSPLYKQENLAQALNTISVDDIADQQMLYFQHNFVESLVLGNWQIASAERFFSQVASRFTPLDNLQKPASAKPAIQSGQHFHFQNEQHKDSCFIWHYIPMLEEQENTQLQLSARSFVLEKVLSYTIFEVLRQKYKMGYTIGAGYKPLGIYPGIALYIESPSHSIAQIFDALIEVVKEGVALLQNNADELEDIKQQLINQVSPHERDISQTANRAWLHFEDKNPVLAYEELVKEIEALDLNLVMKVLTNLHTTSLGQVIFTCDSAEATHLNNFTHIG